MTRLDQLVWQVNDLNDTRIGTITLDEFGFIPHPARGGLTYAHTTFSSAVRSLWATSTSGHGTPPPRTEQ